MSLRTKEKRYLPEFVYGGMDGAITTFAIVSGVMGASLSSVIILILGFANLFADGFSMASANYLSEKSERENHLKKHFHDKRPLRSAVATFISFLVIGIIPLLPFVLGIFSNSATLISNQFLYSAILTGFAFLVVGGVKGKVGGKNKVRSALETFSIGAVAAGIAFVVGYVLRGLV